MKKYANTILISLFFVNGLILTSVSTTHFSANVLCKIIGFINLIICFYFGLAKVIIEIKKSSED